MRILSRPLCSALLLFPFLVVARPAQAQGQQPTNLDRRDIRSSSLSQRRYIQGRVQDADSGDFVFQARVVLHTFGGGIPVGETITDSQGGFFFRDLAPGNYELWITAQGYQDAHESVELSLSSQPGLTVSLRRKPMSQAPLLLEPLSVEEQQVPKEARREHQKGQEELRLGRWAESRAHFERALELYPRYASAQAGLGTALLQQQDLEGAQRAFEAAVEINPNFALPRLFLGGLYNARHQYADAVEQLRKGLSLQPNSWLGHFEISRAYWGLGDIDHAEVHIIRAHELQTRVPQVHLMRANVYVVRKDLAGALQELDECLKLDPPGPLAEATRQWRAALQARRTNTPGP